MELLYDSVNVMCLIFLSLKMFTYINLFIIFNCWIYHYPLSYPYNYSINNFYIFDLCNIFNFYQILLYWFVLYCSYMFSKIKDYELCKKYLKLNRQYVEYKNKYINNCLSFLKIKAT